MYFATYKVYFSTYKQNIYFKLCVKPPSVLATTKTVHRQDGISQNSKFWLHIQRSLPPNELMSVLKYSKREVSSFSVCFNSVMKPLQTTYSSPFWTCEFSLIPHAPLSGNVLDVINHSPQHYQLLPLPEWIISTVLLSHQSFHSKLDTKHCHLVVKILSILDGAK